MPNAENRPFTITRRGLLRIGGAVAAGEAAKTVIPDIPFLSKPTIAKAENTSAPNTITAGFSVENPGIFPNPTSEWVDAAIKDNTIDGVPTPIDRLSQGFPVNGNLKFNFTMSIDDPTNSPTQPSGFKLETGQPKQVDYNKVVIVPFNDQWRLRQRVGKNEDLVKDEVIGNDASSKKGAFSVELSQDGNSISVGLDDRPLTSIPLQVSLFAKSNTLKVLLQQAPQQTVILTQLDVTPTGFTIETPVPTPTPTPDQPPPATPVENRFQFPDFSHPIEAKIGDLETDGFEIINMGKTKGIFVTDMDYARTAIQKHFVESGKKLRIIMYDKSSDIPKSINVVEPGLVRSFPRSDYKDWVEIGNLLENYGRPVEDENGVITLHYAVNNDFTTTVPAYSKLAGNHNVYLQEVVSRDISFWVTGLMRFYSKYIPPMQTNRPFEESGFDEQLNFFSRPIFVATQKIRS